MLFIDEAYTLSQGQSDSNYGREAIDMLLKMMEDYRGRLIANHCPGPRGLPPFAAPRGRELGRG